MDGLFPSVAILAQAILAQGILAEVLPKRRTRSPSASQVAIFSPAPLQPYPSRVTGDLQVRRAQAEGQLRAPVPGRIRDIPSYPHRGSTSPPGPSRKFHTGLRRYRALSIPLLW